MALECSVEYWLRTGTSLVETTDLSLRPHLLFLISVCPELPSLNWSTRWGSKSKLLYVGPLSTWVSIRLIPLSGKLNPQWFLQPDAMQTSCPVPGALLWGSQHEFETHQEGSFQLRYPSSFSAATHGCGGQCFQHLCPSYPSLYGFFCKSVVIIFQFSWPSIDYWGWLLCILVVNAIWHWEDVSVVSTCSESVLKSPFSQFWVQFVSLSSSLWCKARLLILDLSCPLI